MLQAAGLLDGRPVTTHWEDIPLLREKGPDLDVRENVRLIDHGDIAPSAGISAGVDMSLHFVQTLFGGGLSYDVARQMELGPSQRLPVKEQQPPLAE